MRRRCSRHVLRYPFMGVSILLLLLVSSALAQLPDTPFLRIETGMHTAGLRRINVDAQERFLVTASDDKTARVWSLANGELLRVLRPPLGPGNEGRLYAVAISPDGATVAVAGWTQAGTDFHNIYLFDRVSGRLRRRIAGLPNAIFHLAYSLDGRYLVATLGGSNGVRVYDTLEYGEIARDSDYADDSYWAEFDRQGRLLTSCYDGYVRLYDVSFQRIAQRELPGGKRPLAVRFSPDDASVAVGFSDTMAVNVLSGTDLSFLYAPSRPRMDSGNLGSVAWSHDGRLLYAGGIHRYRSDLHPILQWSQAGRGPVTSLPAATNTIMDLRALGDGRLAFGARDPAFGVFDAHGSKVLAQGPATVDYRGRHAALRVSSDGLVVEFGYDTLTADNRWSSHLAQLKVAEGRLQIDPPPLVPGLAEVQRRLAELGYAPGPVDGIAGPRTRAAIKAFQRAQGLVPDGELGPALQQALSGVELMPPRTTGLAVSDWFSTDDPKFDGKPLPLDQYEFSRVLAVAPDDAGFLLGTDWYLRLFDREGQQVWQVPAPSGTRGVNISGDGRLVVADFGDGTLRWYRLRDGAELLALFLHADGKRWVLWTPDGFFTASPGGETLIGYHLNQGPDQAGEFVTVEQLYRLFYRPELVAQRLHDGVEPALQEALTKIGDVRQVLTAGLPPTLELLSAPENRQRERDFTLRFNIHQKDGGIGKVVYRVNGVVVGDLTARPVDITMPYQRRPFTLSPGRNVISVTAFNANDTIESTPIETVVQVDADERRPALYALALGIANYRDQALNLRYAADDARMLVQTLRRQGQGLFTSIEVTSLLDRDATFGNIEAAFRDLADKVQEHDVFLLYLAGHGTTLDGEYYFIPAEVIYENQPALRAGSVHQERLQHWLGTIKAQKSLILLDTCSSGAFVTASAGAAHTFVMARDLAEKGAIDKLMRATGRAVIAASTERQFALEGHQGHGVFTYALLQGLRGEADAQGDRDGAITVDELSAYVAKAVPQITLKKWGYEQFPMRQFGGRPFPIGLVRP